jgi:hypothetical protein
MYAESGFYGKHAAFYDSTLDKIFLSTGVKATDGGGDYTFSLFEIGTDLGILQDYNIGNSN